MNKTMIQRITRRGTVAAMGAAMALAIGAPAQAADPIEIGQITSLTGKNAVQGVDMKRAVELAVERINNGYELPMKNGDSQKIGPGLLDGRKVEVVIGDTESRPKSAMDATRKLVNVDDVPIIIGEYSSGLTVPTAKFSNSNGVIQMGVGSTSPQLIDIEPYFFNGIGTDLLMGKKLGQFAMEDSGAEKLTSIVPNNAFGVGVENNACPQVEDMGGECVNKSRYAAQKSDYRPIIRSTFKGDFDAGMFTAYGSEAKLILKQMHQLGKTPAKGWYSDYPTMWSNEIKDIAEVGEGIKGLKPGPSGGSFYKSEYAEAYKDKYGEAPTTAFGAYAYDNVMMAALAIEKAGTANPDKVKDALHEVSKNYKGVTGDKTFDEHGMQADETYNRVIYKNGELQPYNP